MPHPGKATWVREGVEPHPGISLGRYRRAIAQTVRGRIVPSPEPPFFRFANAHPKKRLRKKKNLNRMCIRDMRSISLGRELGAIAQTVRGRIVPSPEPPFFREAFSGFFEPRKAFREK